MVDGHVHGYDKGDGARMGESLRDALRRIFDRHYAGRLTQDEKDEIQRGKDEADRNRQSFPYDGP
jgi:hypothetical protein